MGAFVDAQNQAYSKIRAMENEVESHRQHINTLKRELSDAVRREYDEQVGCHGNISTILVIRSVTDVLRAQSRFVKFGGGGGGGEAADFITNMSC